MKKAHVWTIAGGLGVALWLFGGTGLLFVTSVALGTLRGLAFLLTGR